MYKIATPLLSLIVLIAVALLIYPCQQKDYAIYHELLASSKPIIQEGSSVSLHQMRGQVDKRIWFQKGKASLQFQIKSENSELFLTKKSHSIESMERLGKIDGMFQEALYYEEEQPMQKVCYFEAENANYHYHSQELDGENVRIWKFQIEGHRLPECKPDLSPLLQAKAQTIKCALDGEKVDMEAKNVSLFLEEGGILKCDSLQVDHTKKKIWLAGNPEVIYSDQMGEVYADRAQIDYEEAEGKFSVTQVLLLDHVKLINRGRAAKPACQYALADELLYFPSDQLMLLKGNQERVLFYDTLHAIQISAPTVQAQRHPETGKESIRGMGDVRCRFGIEEFERVKKSFKIR